MPQGPMPSALKLYTSEAAVVGMVVVVVLAVLAVMRVTMVIVTRGRERKRNAPGEACWEVCTLCARITRKLSRQSKIPLKNFESQTARKRRRLNHFEPQLSSRYQHLLLAHALELKQQPGGAPYTIQLPHHGVGGQGRETRCGSWKHRPLS